MTTDYDLVQRILGALFVSHNTVADPRHRRIFPEVDSDEGIGPDRVIAEIMELTNNPVARGVVRGGPHQTTVESFQLLHVRFAGVLTDLGDEVG